MKRKEYLEQMSKCNVDQDRVDKIEKMYNNAIPTIVKHMISFSEESVFFDDDWRTLSFSEIVEAVQDLHVDFVKLGIIPLVDCGENDFIVYNFEDKIWSKFNIIDECNFKKKAKLSELMQ